MVIGMTDDDKRKAETGNPEDIKERAEYTPSVQSDFLREKMKQRPVNKKKLWYWRSSLELWHALRF